MTEALGALNRKMPRNAKVRLRQQGKNRISITPFEPLPAALNLEAIKTELERRWPMTDLIDVLMETARQTGSSMSSRRRATGSLSMPIHSAGVLSCASTVSAPMPA
ncbi:hypothetical protein ACFSHP_25150 [Novosphingobium panipatense]